MSFPAIVGERFRRKVDILAVLAMRDMEPDPVTADTADNADNAEQCDVAVVFGTDNWVARLVDQAITFASTSRPQRNISRRK